MSSLPHDECMWTPTCHYPAKYEARRRLYPTVIWSHEDNYTVPRRAPEVDVRVVCGVHRRSALARGYLVAQ